MANTIETTFFFLHRQIQKINSIFTSKKIPLILAPLLPLSVAILCIVQICVGVFIIFYSIVLFFAVLFTFLLTVSSVYILRGDNIFTRYNRYKSNSNLSQFQNSLKGSKNISEKTIKELLDSNKKDINNYYNKLKNIGLINDDTLLIDFQNLISNCIDKPKDNSFFKLEINASQTHSFIHEFLIPLLKKIEPNIKIINKNIASLIQYKKGGKYYLVNEKSLSDKNRRSVTSYQRKIYESI